MNRYTYYDYDLGRYVVPCYQRADGNDIAFHVRAGKVETVENGRGQRLVVSKTPDLVFGEVIDRLAELENKEEVQSNV